MQGRVINDRQRLNLLLSAAVGYLAGCFTPELQLPEICPGASWCEHPTKVFAHARELNEKQKAANASRQ